MNPADMKRIAALMSRVMRSPGDDKTASSVREEVRDLCRAHPLPYRPLAAATA